jgi:HK97 family phage portal protein
MGFFDRFRAKKVEPEKRNYVDYAMGLNLSSKDVLVTPETALTFSAVYAAVRVISETIAQLPFNYYKKTNKGREIYTDSPLQFLVNNEPNGYQTKYVFFEYFINTLLLYGNAYAYIQRDGVGTPIALTCLHPDDVQVKEKGGRLVYEVREQGMYDASDILHVPDLTLDGYIGKSRISAARDNIALGIAAQTYGKNFFESGAKISGVLKHPGQLGADAMQSLSQQWHRTYHSGYAGGFKTAVLEEGMDYKPIQLSPQDAQFLSTRQFSILEVARIMRVPPHMLADLSRATFSNIEHQAIEFVTHTINPIIKKIEQEFNKKLIFQGNKVNTYFEHNVNALLRGDAKSRAEYYKSLFNVGAISPNEIRRKENMNDIEKGDVYYVPMNMIDATKENPKNVKVKEQPKQDKENGENGDKTI